MARKAVLGDFVLNQEEAASVAVPAVNAERKPPAVKRRARKVKRSAPPARREPQSAGRPAVAIEAPARYGPRPVVPTPPPPDPPPAARAVRGGKPGRQAPPPRKGPRPPLPKLDPLRVAQEEALHFMKGNEKLRQAVDVMRTGLETIIAAEWDYERGRPVSTDDMRGLARETMDAYSSITGQDWRRHRLTGASLAGDRNLPDRLDGE